MTPSGVNELIKNLIPTKSCGEDSNTVHLKTDAGLGILTPLTHIFNVSLNTKQFTSAWKIANITPIHKDGDRSDPNN